MKDMSLEIKNRLLFEGVVDNSFGFNINSINEIELVTNGIKEYTILTGYDIELGFEITEEIITIVYIRENVVNRFDIKELYSKINKDYQNIKKTKEYTDHITKKSGFNFKVYFILNNLDYRYKLEIKLDSDKSLSVPKLRKEFDFLSSLAGFKANNIMVSYDFISLKDEEQYIARIEVLSRVLVSNYTFPERNMFGSVYTAKLRDLVSIFEVKSNKLFKDNVRYGISDNNSVDFNIMKTLKDCPSEFWYLNNGITIYSKNAVDLTSRQHIIFKNNNFSVVNGAQTITSATKFFFSNIDIELIKNAEENAYVILKIIEGEEKYVNSITVSLNRQKPILAEDTEFFTPGISTLNHITSDVESKIENSVEFQIVRRGEAVSIPYHCYSLSSVARMITAVKLKKPGFARSGGLASILKQTLFFPEITKKEDFMVNYWYLNSSMLFHSELLEFIKSAEFSDFLTKNKDESSEYKSIVNYGQYHLVSGFINTFLDENSVLNEKINFGNSIFTECIKIMHDFWKEYYTDPKVVLDIWDSNMFKHKNDDDKFIEKFKLRIRNSSNIYTRIIGLILDK